MFSLNDDCRPRTFTNVQRPAFPLGGPRPECKLTSGAVPTRGHQCPSMKKIGKLACTCTHLLYLMTHSTCFTFKLTITSIRPFCSRPFGAQYRACTPQKPLKARVISVHLGLEPNGHAPNGPSLRQTHRAKMHLQGNADMGITHAGKSRGGSYLPLGWE